jgi:hypothetical protein
MLHGGSSFLVMKECYVFPLCRGAGAQPIGLKKFVGMSRKTAMPSRCNR